MKQPQSFCNLFNHFSIEMQSLQTIFFRFDDAKIVHILVPPKFRHNKCGFLFVIFHLWYTFARFSYQLWQYANSNHI